jgi:hypothetical protein
MLTLLLIAAVFLIAFGAASGAGFVQAVTGRAMDTQFVNDYANGLIPSYAAGAYDASIVALANAIAVAENSNPLYFNPGDLKPLGWTGPTFGAGIAVFASVDEGMSRLCYQLYLILNGQSHVYSLADTILTMSVKWTLGVNQQPTTESNNWAATVAQQLNVDPSAPLSSVLS